MTDKLPSSKEAEVEVLGSCLMEPSVVARAIEKDITDKHFYYASHQEIWGAIKAIALEQSYNHVNLSTLSIQLKKERCLMMR